MAIKPSLFTAELANNVQQDNPGSAPALLQLPREILEVIGIFVVKTGEKKAAVKDAVNFGLVSTLANRVTEQKAIAGVLTEASKSWIVDPNDSSRQIQVDRTGKIRSAMIQHPFYL